MCVRLEKSSETGTLERTYVNAEPAFRFHTETAPEAASAPQSATVVLLELTNERDAKMKNYLEWRGEYGWW